MLLRWWPGGALRSAAPDNRVALPSDLAAVSTFDPAEADPDEGGMSRQGVERIWQAVQELYRTGLHPGIGLCLRRRGRLMLNRAIGHAHGNGPGDSGDDRALFRPDTPVCLFSASKAVTAMLAHKMVEQGKLRLDDRVADYIPEYAANGKGGTTLRQLLSHRAGIPRLPLDGAGPEALNDWDRVIELLCAAKASHAYGRQQSYHAVTGGYIVGELIRRVSGVPLRSVLRRELAGPLGCTYFSYGLTARQRRALGHSYSTGRPAPFPIDLVARRALGLEFEKVASLASQPGFLSAVIPAANIYSTADESCRFYQMLLDHGSFQGRQVFRPETVAEAVRPAGRLAIDRTLLVPVRFSAGFVLGERLFGLYGANCPRAFGHLGFINIVCWADPDRELSVALLNTGKSTEPYGVAALAKVLWTISQCCPRTARV